MPAWIASIIVALMTKLTSWLLTKGLEVVHGKQDQAATDADIDARLASFKNAYKEAFNGQPVTVDQRQKLNQAIADFIRGGTNGGL